MPILLEASVLFRQLTMFCFYRCILGSISQSQKSIDLFTCVLPTKNARLCITYTFAHFTVVQLVLSFRILWDKEEKERMNIFSS
jgi:hypothetical protein